MQLGHLVVVPGRGAAVDTNRGPQQWATRAQHLYDGAESIGTPDAVQAGEGADEPIAVARDVRGGNARHGTTLCHVGEGEVGEPRHEAAYETLDSPSGDGRRGDGY
jgi:hypothetical protein